MNKTTTHKNTYTNTTVKTIEQHCNNNKTTYAHKQAINKKLQTCTHKKQHIAIKRQQQNTQQQKTCTRNTSTKKGRGKHQQRKHRNKHEHINKTLQTQHAKRTRQHKNKPTSTSNK